MKAKLAILIVGFTSTAAASELGGAPSQSAGGISSGQRTAPAPGQVSATPPPFNLPPIPSTGSSVNSDAKTAQLRSRVGAVYNGAMANMYRKQCTKKNYYACVMAINHAANAVSMWTTSNGAGNTAGLTDINLGNMGGNPYAGIGALTGPGGPGGPGGIDTNGDGIPDTNLAGSNAPGAPNPYSPAGTNPYGAGSGGADSYGSLPGGGSGPYGSNPYGSSGGGVDPYGNLPGGGYDPYGGGNPYGNLPGGPNGSNPYGNLPGAPNGGNPYGNFPGGGAGGPNGSNPFGGPGGMGGSQNAAINAEIAKYQQMMKSGSQVLAAGGIKMNADGSVTLPDGRTVPASALNSPAAMAAMGLTPQQIAEIKASKNSLASSLKGQLKALSLELDSGGGGGGRNFGSLGRGNGPSLASFRGPNWAALMGNTGEARKPSANVKGLSKQLGNDKIGVGDDNIFEMVSRQYQKEESKQSFIQSARPGAPISFPGMRQRSNFGGSSD